MLNGVLDAVCASLTLQKVRALRCYPDEEATLAEGAVICVGAESCKCLSPGLGDYLGVSEGKGGTADVELYGKRLELVLCFEVLCSFERENGAGECLALAGRLEELLKTMPSGIKREKLELGKVIPDREGGYFSCKCRLFCTAYLVAESQGDEDEFLDFVLKGTVKNDK